MDRDALKAEFQALVTPFEEDRERAAALLPRDIPEEDIFEILRKMKTAGFLEMPKLLEKAEEASMLVHRALGSLVAERTAVYTKLIPKLMSEVTRKETANTQESVNTHQDTPANPPDTTQTEDQTKDQAKKQDKPTQPQARRHVSIPEATSIYITKLNESHHWRMRPFREFHKLWQQARDNRAALMQSDEVKFIVKHSDVPDPATVDNKTLQHKIINSILNHDTRFPVRAASTEFLRKILNETLELHEEAITAIEDTAELDEKYPELQWCFQTLIADSVRDDDTKPDNHIYTSCGHILCNHVCLDNERQKGAAAGLDGGVCRVCGAVFDTMDADMAKERVFSPPTTADINASDIISTYNIPEDSPLERLVRLVCSKCAVRPSPEMLLGLGHALILYRDRDIEMEDVLESLTESITDNPDKVADL